VSGKSDAAFTAIVDQTIAAAEAGAGFMAGFQAVKGGTMRGFSELRGPQGHVVAEYDLRAARGEIEPCPHLGRSPQPMYWSAHEPGRLCCARCHDRAQSALAGTEEDRRCDFCGRVEEAGQVYASAASRAAVVVRAPDGRVTAAGPLILRWGLCRACNASSSEGYRG